MKLSLKSLFPSTLFSKITLKAAILVALILFYLVIIFSSSREGLETTAPKPMADVQQMIDQVTKKPTEPSTVDSESATPTESTESTDMATPTESATPTKPAVETMASPSKTPYSTY